MLRVLFFLIFVFAIGLGFAWLADRPGDLVVTFNGYQYQVTLMVAAMLLAAIVATVMLTWWLVKAVWNSPYTVARYFRVRRRDRGYQALSTGMIAAGAGDAALARKKNREAAKLIRSDQEPLIHLLDAQTLLLEGDHDSARARFEAMLDDPEMRILGLRGLYLEAERAGERQAARHYAAQAADIAPQLGWAAESTLEERVEQGDWDGALRIVDRQKASRQMEREKVNRRRAVLLTAKAMSALQADPLAARNAAQEALRLEPGFVPAAAVSARALFRLDDVRKGARVLETIWKQAPHPEIADLYIHARHGDSTHDRLKRARKLESLRPNNPDAHHAVARAALEAGELKQARTAAEALIRQEPREGAFLLMADIEEAETGEQGRVRQWLARAVRAPRDPAWVADGYVSDRWAPFSPVTGRIDAFEWRTPVERVAQMIEQDADGAPAQLESLPVPMREPEQPPVKEVEIDAPASAVVDAAPVKPTPLTPEPASADPARPAPAAETAPATTPAAGDGAKLKPAAEAPASEAAKPSQPPVPPAPTSKDDPGNEMPSRRKARSGERETAEVVMFQRPPDDPGVDPEDDGKETPSRFRLF